ncbi:MAG: helix-turn-helix transcriptional regulator [Thermoguttaceae bacterium]
MNKEITNRVVVIEHRLFLADLLQYRLRKTFPNVDVHITNSSDGALKTVYRHFHSLKCLETMISPIFVIGGNSYFATMTIFNRLATCFPRAKYVLLDDIARHGCSVLAERLAFHGYFTLSDTPKDCIECFESIFENKPFVAPNGVHYLSTDATCDLLCAKNEIRNEHPHTFTEQEWLCFQYLILGKEISVVARRLCIEDRSAVNLQYRIMKKLHVNKWIEVLLLALHWGFLDSRTHKQL